jgi:hypothetical protein
MFLAKADKQAIGVSAFMLLAIGVYIIVQYVQNN